ncbi:hypothetical protein GDO81_002586 [Engystomops pustulosus]|uniref:Uncharacterized protein n=1 Tax=Engystomops pustulosus TaxID=76066 RepID=A0AAV7DLE9_ENGPU|nr:hypothetical protein GDO81_002586 [Engystomops pustulosus]
MKHKTLTTRPISKAIVRGNHMLPSKGNHIVQRQKMFFFRMSPSAKNMSQDQALCASFLGLSGAKVCHQAQWRDNLVTHKG